MRGGVYFAIAGLVLALASAGCSRSDGPRLATVKGVVLLDGQPLANARVVFQPVATGKQMSPSFAETSANGEFELQFSRDRSGAIIGAHHVQVTTERLVSDVNGHETLIAERIPIRFNRNSELKFEVKSGANRFEIKLDSRGPIQQQGAPVIPISC